MGAVGEYTEKCYICLPVNKEKCIKMLLLYIVHLQHMYSDERGIWKIWENATNTNHMIKSRENNLQ